MTNTVRPRMKRSNASWMSDSEWISSADVGSSRKTTGGSCNSARQIASFCFIPLENVTMEAEISPSGDVSVEGHHVGQLDGFRFAADKSAEGEDATLFEFPHKRVLVFGNEAEGMRRLVRESCDYAVKIPMAEGVESLNISVATGIVLYLARADLEVDAAADGVVTEALGDTAEREPGGHRRRVLWRCIR